MSGCDVYWGSHGCDRPAGHRGFCSCPSCFDPDDNDGYVGVFPYYGRDTSFYGDDRRWAQRRFDLAYRFPLVVLIPFRVRMARRRVRRRWEHVG